MKDLFQEGLKLYKEKKYEEAYALFSTGTKEDDARCIHARGLCIFMGKGVKQNKRLGKKIVKDNLSRLEEDGIQNCPGANKLLYLAYSSSDLPFISDYREAFKALKRIYDNQLELEEDLLMDLAEAYERALGTSIDYVKANELYKECIEKFNSTNAMLNLALRCLIGLTRNDISTPDITQGLYYLKRAAELKDRTALRYLIDIYLGIDYFDAIDNMCDYSLAKEYIDVLCDNTQITGNVYLSIYFALTGNFKEMNTVLNNLDCKNKEKARVFLHIWASITMICHRNKNATERLEKWKLASLERLVKLNIEYSLPYTNMAYFYLGIYYDNNRNYRHLDRNDVNLIIDKAIGCYQKGIKNNEYLSFQEYANMLINGEHITKDEKLGLDLLLKGFQLEKDGSCANKIAYMYEFGIGTRTNKQKAVEWYKKAAKCDDGHAFANISLMFLRKDSKNDEDIRLSSELNEKIKKYGIDNASQNCINDLDNKYISFPTIYAKKYFWILQYLYDIGLGESPTFTYACAYEQGLGFNVDKKKALELYKKALREGHSTAAIEIGRMYYEAESGIKRNIPLAIKYIEIGSNSFGYLGYANLELYKIYSDNSTKYFNIEKAIRCLEAVPENEEFSIGQAKYLLGYAYYDGWGVDRDLNKAKECFELAFKNGYNCSYAIEIVKRELGEESKDNAMHEYAEKVVKKRIPNDKLYVSISKDLEKDFGGAWSLLDKDTKNFLISGVSTYVIYYSMGAQIYGNLDFSQPIIEMCKALERELGKYLYSGYVRFLQAENVNPKNFNSKRPFIKKISANEYDYYSPNDVKKFTLGSFGEILGVERTIKPSFPNNKITQKGATYELKIDDTMSAYLDRLFKKEAFSEENRNREILITLFRCIKRFSRSLTHFAIRPHIPIL